MFDFLDVCPAKLNCIRPVQLASFESSVPSYLLNFHPPLVRWLSPFQAIEKILQIFEPPNIYFLALENHITRTLEEFFDNGINDGYFCAVHCFMEISWIASKIQKKQTFPWGRYLKTVSKQWTEWMQDM